MKVILKMIKEMDMGNLLIYLNQFMKEHGRIIQHMDGIICM